MKRRDLILAIIHACEGNPDFGRTSLQKVAYFAAAVFKSDLGHHAYFYGPFSSSVENEVQALVFSSLIEEKSRTLGVNSRGLVARYEYSVTDLGTKRLRQLEEAYPKEMTMISDVVDHIQTSAGTLHQRILSTGAKVHFIQDMENSKLSPEEVKELAGNLGWKLGKNQIKSVQSLVDEIEGYKTSLVSSPLPGNSVQSTHA